MISAFPGLGMSAFTLKNIVYLSDYSMMSATSTFRSFIKSLAVWFIISLKLSKPTPPFPMSRLKSLIPITILESSQSYATFSGVVSETNGLKPARGRTLSRAAATSRSMVLFMALVSFI